MAILSPWASHDARILCETHEAVAFNKNFSGVRRVPGRHKREEQVILKVIIITKDSVIEHLLQ
jgi:hypothetical protein